MVSHLLTVDLIFSSIRQSESLLYYLFESVRIMIVYVKEAQDIFKTKSFSSTYFVKLTSSSFSSKLQLKKR